MADIISPGATGRSTPAPSTPAETLTRVENQPRGMSRFLKWLARAIPNFLVLTALAGVAFWGQLNDWKLPPFAELPGQSSATESNWCAEHDVPESICVECDPSRFPKPPDYGFCEVHGVHNCSIDHPDVAQLQPSEPVIIQDPAVVDRALSLRPRSENNAACPLYKRRVQLPSIDAMTMAGLDVSQVALRPMVEFISANGEIGYDRTRVTHLSSPVAGKLHQIRSREGAVVQKGEILALVDSMEIGQAKADFLQALSRHDQETQLLQNVQGLITNGVYREGAMQDVEARAAVREADVNLVQAEQALLNLGFAIDAHDYAGLPVAEVAGRIRFLGLSKEIVESLDDEIRTANLLPMRAVHQGVLISRESVEGEVIDRDDTILTYAGVSQMWANLKLRQDDAVFVKLYQPVEFLPDGIVKPVPGKISWISTAADEKSRTVEVRAELENSDGRLRAGMFGTGKIILRDEPMTVTVENEAIHWDGSCNVIFVRDRDFFQNEFSKIFHTRTVRLGAKDDLHTEIIAGVLPNEVIATKGSSVLMAAVLKGNLGAG